MHYDPRGPDRPIRYDPIKSLTIPRPVGWISTTSLDKKDNLAPFSHWQNINTRPHVVMFAADRHRDGRRKDTVVNAEDTGYFVWNMTTYDLREAMNESSRPVAKEIDEFKLAGLNKLPSIEAPGPRVAESPCHYECKYLTTLRFPGTTSLTDTDVVFGEIVQVHIDDDLVMPTGKVDVLNMRPLARLGYFDYTYVSDFFEMQAPAGVDPARMAGMNGQPPISEERK